MIQQWALSSLRLRQLRWNDRNVLQLDKKKNMSPDSRIDPLLFRPEAITAETARFNEMLAASMAALPAMHDQQPQALRDAHRVDDGLFGPLVFDDSAEERSIPGPGGQIGLRIFHPTREPRGVYLFFHGGGWVLGGADQQDGLLAKSAARTGCVVVSVDYRLAPEHPYPAAPDDCEVVAVWLAKGARREFGSDRLVIGGASAGAHLAVLTLLRMRDRHGYNDFQAANLTYGVFDLSETPSQSRAPQQYMIPLATMRWFYDHYVPTQDRRDPDVSPLYASLHDMPQALFTVGTLDPLLDDTLYMVSRWQAAGCEAQIAAYPGGVHGFNLMPGLKIGEEAGHRIDQFLAGAVAE
jgi:acetyl esterase/lipase